jgi:hypothetical protein
MANPAFDGRCANRRATGSMPPPVMVHVGGGDEIATRHLYAQGREQLSAERRAGFESNNRRTAMTIYWRFFNFLVRRIIAVSFAVGGVIVSLTHTGNKLLGLR